MQMCDKCHVKIRGRKAVCPLCEGELAGEPEDPAFPVLPARRYTSRQVAKTALFLFLALEIVMLTVRYIFGPRAAWSTAVCLWAPLGLAGLLITMAYRYSILKLISAEVYIAMVLNILIDIATGGHGWAVEFVVPALFLGLAVSLWCVAKGLKMTPNEYLMYLITAEVVSFIQTVFILTGKNSQPWLAAAVMAAMLILLLAELIFLFQDFRNTTAKTLHL